MRSTVGPLSPAVYWRRRVVVLGALLLVVILLFVSCGGEDDSKKRGSGKGTAASQAPTPGPDDSSSPEAEPSFTDDKPAGPGVPDPGSSQSGVPDPGPGTAPSGGTGTGTNNNVTAPADGSCADQEITLTPIAASTTIKRNTSVGFRLKIKNVSARSCTRDLGAGAQELYVDQGARKFWSSDTCSTDRSKNVITMRPGSEFEYTVTWNGRQTTKCTGGMPGGDAAPVGQYALRARLDRKISEPVTLTITA